MVFKPNISVVGKIGNGFLAVMPKPIDGEWIEEEFSNISAFGIQRVVSLLEFEEAKDFGMGDEKALCEKNGMEFVSYPICDRGLPSSVDEFAEFTREIFAKVDAGRNTVVHCLAGIGRSGIVAGAVLVHSGIEARDAFDQITKARGLRVPDTEEQRDWLIKHQKKIKSVSKDEAQR